MAEKSVLTEHLLQKKICMKCNAVNPKDATKCRKCGSSQLRAKAKEARL